MHDETATDQIHDETDPSMGQTIQQDVKHPAMVPNYLD